MVTGARYWISQSTRPTPSRAQRVLQGDLTVNGPRLIASGDVTIPVWCRTLPTRTPCAVRLRQARRGQLPALRPGLGRARSCWARATWARPCRRRSSSTRRLRRARPITLDPTATNGVHGQRDEAGQRPDHGHGHRHSQQPSPLSRATSTRCRTSPSRQRTPTGSTSRRCPANTWSADMPLSWLAAKKADGPVTLVVVGTDAAGNRGDGSTPAGSGDHHSSTGRRLDRASPARRSSGSATGARDPVHGLRRGLGHGCELRGVLPRHRPRTRKRLPDQRRLHPRRQPRRSGRGYDDGDGRDHAQRAGVQRHLHVTRTPATSPSPCGPATSRGTGRSRR